MGIIFVLGFKAQYDEAQRIQSLPILDATLVQDRNFFDKILAPLEKNQLERNSIQMRLRGTQIWAEPLQCENNQQIKYGTLLVQLGPETEVLVVASGYAYGGFKELLAKSQNNQGKTLELIGTLKRIPRDWQYKYTEWKVYCGLKDLPEAPRNGRWIFEVKGLER